MTGPRTGDGDDRGRPGVVPAGTGGAGGAAATGPAPVAGAAGPRPLADGGAAPAGAEAPPWTPYGVGASAPAGATPFPTDLAAAAEAQDLGPELVHLAWEITRLAGPSSAAGQRALLLLGLAVLAAERGGSSRLPLAPAVLAPLLAELGATASDVAAVERLVAAAREGDDPGLIRLFGKPGDYRPLIRTGYHLYTQRSWQLERNVAERLRGLLAAPAPGTAAATGVAIDAALADVLARPPRDAAGRPLALSAEQQSAVHSALAGRLAAITGGPGTGKTWILAALLRVVARLGDPPLAQTALAAPTGKAADRIRASLLAVLRAVAEPADADLALLAAPPAALTLHRLLSYSPAGERFRHHERNPLGERLVLVDESSMMDLALADHLLRSLPADGRLVLLGDAQQLPSVAPGAVLRDLVEAPAAAARVSRLRHSWRMDAGDPAGRAIATLAAAVAAGDVGEVGEVMTVHTAASQLTFAGPELLASPPATLSGFLARWWDARIAAAAGWQAAIAIEWEASAAALDARHSGPLAALFGVYEASRLLTVTRGWTHGTGAAAVNAWCRAALVRASGGRPAGGGVGGDPLAGEPVLVTRNDYRHGLFNGDQGVVLQVRVDGGPSLPSAVFRAADGFRALPLAALRGRLEPGWATTVHKAQGSEHEVVALVLPVTPNRLLTRELLYTALTRARRGVVVVGSEQVLRLAAARATERWSGLGEGLGDGERPQPAIANTPARQLALPF